MLKTSLYRMNRLYYYQNEIENNIWGNRTLKSTKTDITDWSLNYEWGKRPL